MKLTQKRLLSLFMALCVVIGLLPLTAFAIDETKATIALTTSASGDIEKGSSFTVSADLTANPEGFSALGITLNWNKDVLRFDGFETEYNDILDDDVLKNSIIANATINNVGGSVQWSAIKNKTDSTGHIFTARFTAIGTGECNIAIQKENNESGIGAFTIGRIISENEAMVATTANLDETAVAGLKVIQSANTVIGLPENFPVKNIQTDVGGQITVAKAAEPIYLEDIYEEFDHYIITLPRGANKVEMTFEEGHLLHQEYQNGKAEARLIAYVDPGIDPIFGWENPGRWKENYDAAKIYSAGDKQIVRFNLDNPVIVNKTYPGTISFTNADWSMDAVYTFEVVHDHALSYTAQVDAVKCADGNEGRDGCKGCYQCSVCYARFEDAAATKRVTDTELVLTMHTIVHKDMVPATCNTYGFEEHYECMGCGEFVDESGNWVDEWDYRISKTNDHPGFIEHEAKAATAFEAGNIYYKECTLCGKYYDADGKQLSKSKVTIAALPETVVTVIPTVNESKASAEIPADTLVAENKPAVMVVTSGTEGVKETELAVPAAVKENLSKAKNVTVNADTGSIVFDQAAVAGITKGAGEGGFFIRIKEKTAPAGTPGVAEGAKLIELTVTDAESNNLFDGTFEGFATITVPYTAELLESHRAVVYYYNVATEEYEPVDCSYDADSKTVTFTAEHFSEYLLTQREFPKEYTITAEADKTLTKKDDTVKISVKVSDHSFEAAEIVLTYDPSLFAYSSAETFVDGTGVTNDTENGQVTIQFESTSSAASGTVLAELSFTAKEVAGSQNGNFGFKSAKAGELAWSTTGDYPEATTNSVSVEVAEMYAVLFMKMDGTTQIGETMYVKKNTVPSVSWFPEAPEEEYCDYSGKWTDGNVTYAPNIFSNQYVYKIKKDTTFVPVYNAKQFDVSLGSGLEGANKAQYGKDYAVTVSNFDALKHYTVKYTVGEGEAAVAGAGESAGTFIIPGSAIKGAVSVKVTVETAPTAKALTYTGSAQDLINAGSATGGEMQYCLTEDGTYSATIPTGTNAGDYTVWYKVVGDDNHNDVTAKSVSVTIAKDNASCTAPTGKTGLKYTGSAMDLVTAGTATGGTMKYCLTESGTYSKTVPQGTNAGTYTVYYKVEGDANHNDVTAKSVSVTIAKANASCTAPTGKTGLKYTGSAQDLVTAGTATGGEMQYSLTESGTYSKTVPQGTNAGTYTVYYKVVGDANHNDVAAQSISVTIAKAAATCTAPTGKTGLVYTGKAQVLVSEGTASGGEMQYSLTESGTYSKTVPQGTNAGTYTVYYKVVGDSNHKDVAAKSVSVTIGKANASCTAPTGKTGLKYTGSAMNLVTAGTATGGEMQYSLTESGTYSATIPTGTNAGDYTVWYKVVGDDNHNDTTPAKISVYIAKAAAPAAPTTPDGVNCTTSAQNNGKITGVNSTMEYKPASASVWTNVTGNEITGLVPGEYEIRVAETNNVLAGKAAEVTIVKHDCEFTTYAYNNDDTCAKNGTETAHCTGEGCKATNTRESAGTMTAHAYVNGVCKNCQAVNPVGATLSKKTVTSVEKVTALVSAGKIAVEEGKSEALVQAIRDDKLTTKNEVKTISTPTNVTAFTDKVTEVVSRDSSMKNAEVVGYLDISVALLANGTEVLGSINETDQPVTFQIKLEDTRLADLVGKQVFVLRKHGSEITKLPATLNEGILTFSSDEFSTYAIVAYEPVSGGSHHGGSYTPGHTVTSDLKNVTKVTIDGKVVDSKYYTVSGGNIILSGEFMKTLANGKHTVKLYDGAKVATGVITVTGNTNVASAATGDMGVALYAGLAISSLLGMGWVAKKKRCEK